MTAEQARNKVLQVKSDKAAAQEKDIRNKIETAVDNLYFNVSIYGGDLIPEVKEVFEKDGFIIKTRKSGPNEQETVISWE